MNQLKRYCLVLILLFVFISCKDVTKNVRTDSTSKFNLENQEIKKIPLPENGFYSGFLDSKGNLWFGSRGNGVFKFDGKSFINYTKDDGLCDNDISCVAEDQEGNFWFGTTNGACRFDGEKFETLQIPQSDTSSIWLDEVYPVVNPNQVMSILEDTQGNLWFGSNGAGVYKYNKKTFTQHLTNVGMIYKDGNYHNIILSIIEDLVGNIWFTSLSHGGVSVYDGEKFTHYTNELSDDFVRVVFCDSSGKIWIGTHGNNKGGLDRFDGQNFTAFYKTNDGLSHNNVKGIYEDRTGLFWLASGTTELTTFDGKNFTIFTDQNGKTYHSITFVLGDKHDNIWFGNRDGLWKFNGKEVIEITQS